MTTSGPGWLSGTPGWPAVRALVAGLSAGLVAAGCAAGTDPGALQDLPGTTRQQLIQERDEPAVVLLETSYATTFSVPGVDGDTPAEHALIASLQARGRTGEIPNTTKALTDVEVQELDAHPDLYFKTVDPVRTVPATATFRCTGSIVTPDGYVVTAAHCTAPATDARNSAYLRSGLQAAIDASAQDQVNASCCAFDNDQQKYLFEACQKFVASHVQVAVAEATTLTALLFPSSSTGHRQETKAPLTVVTQGKAPPASSGPFGDRDVSIVKLAGFRDLPTLPVGSDRDIEAGQQLYVDGYPGAAENGNLENLSTPSVTTGPISAKKTSDQGLPLLETPATVSGGNSGGPGLNDANQMVGVVSYGSALAGAAYNYLIGASVVQEDLRQKGIRPRESATTHYLDLALNDLHRQYLKRALAELQRVKQLDPGHPTVDTFIVRTQEDVQQGRDRTPLLDGLALLLAAAAAGTLLLVTVVVGVVVVVLVRQTSGSRAGG
jgi:serine protease Do